MELDFRTLDVFTGETFGGNPLGVFPDAAHLPPALMQKIAREMNLAETVFLGPPETPEGTARVRIFTPEVEVPFAGHPTVGAAIYLAGTQPVRREAGVHRNEDGRANLVLEENVGLVPASVEYRRGRPVFARFTTAVRPERRGSPHSAERLAAMVGLEANDLGGDAPARLAPAMMSCGLPFHVIPVRTPAALRRAALNMAVWQDLLAGSWAHHVYLVCPVGEGGGGEGEGASRRAGREVRATTAGPGTGRTGGSAVGAAEGSPPPDVRVRMFAPGSGVPEDPATGSAAAVLGAYLGDASRRLSGTLGWRVEQGDEVGRPSLIEVEADKVAGRVTTVRVGGAATFVSRGAMTVPGPPIAPPESRRAPWLARYAGRL